MTTKLSNLFYTFLNIAASTQKLGINLIRVAILIIFVWIGGLKFYNYEAEGIVPFVANSPFMSFFYTKSAPEYKEYKLKEGEFNEAKHQWHVENNTYGFSHGLGILIMAIGILTFLGIFSPKIGLVGAGLAIIMTIGTLSFLVTTPEVWVPDLGSGEHGFPLLTGAGRLVIKDTAIIAGAIVVFSDCAQDIETEEIKSRKGLPTHCIATPFLFFYKSTFNLPKLPAHPPIPARFRISKSNKPGYHRCRLRHRLAAAESKPHIYLLQPYVAKQLSNQI